MHGTQIEREIRAVVISAATQDHRIGIAEGPNWNPERKARVQAQMWRANEVRNVLLDEATRKLKRTTVESMIKAEQCRKWHDRISFSGTKYAKLRCTAPIDPCHMRVAFALPQEHYLHHGAAQRQVYTWAEELTTVYSTQAILDRKTCYVRSKPYKSTQALFTGREAVMRALKRNNETIVGAWSLILPDNSFCLFVSLACDRRLEDLSLIIRSITSSGFRVAQSELLTSPLQIEAYCCVYATEHTNLGPVRIVDRAWERKWYAITRAYPNIEQLFGTPDMPTLAALSRVNVRLITAFGVYQGKQRAMHEAYPSVATHAPETTTLVAAINALAYERDTVRTKEDLQTVDAKIRNLELRTLEYKKATREDRAIPEIEAAYIAHARLKVLRRTTRKLVKYAKTAAEMNTTPQLPTVHANCTCRRHGCLIVHERFVVPGFLGQQLDMLNADAPAQAPVAAPVLRRVVTARMLRAQAASAPSPTCRVHSPAAVFLAPPM